MSQPHFDLPLAGAPPPERADAARNRRRVLDAAARLIARRGPEAVSMDAVAEAAGVGKGTLYRRFGDRQGLLLALLDEDERALQDSVLTGPSPLGPGAPAAERLSAFLDALVDLLERRGDIIRASETQAHGARMRGGAYGAWHLHLALLLAEAGSGDDPDTLAHLLLAPLAGETWTSLRGELGRERARLTEALRQLWLESAGSSNAS